MAVDRLLPPLATSAGEARRLLRAALAEIGGQDALEPDQLEAAQIAISEIVTNALVHAGTTMRLRVMLTSGRLRVELSDGSPHLPRRRDHTENAVTGRGLHVISEIVDRWGSYAIGDGKVVWFEIRDADDEHPETTLPDRHDPAVVAEVEVELLNMPLLMHAAWQEHASALLREVLLVRLDDDADVISQHAAASDALGLLFEQVPEPDLHDEPSAIMATAVDPEVSLERLLVTVPQPSTPNFETLDDMLEEAVRLADLGELLASPTPPEIRAMRQWLCQQVREQALGLDPQPWSSPTTAAARTLGSFGLEWDPTTVTESDRALLAADDTNLIVAVSPAAAELLGYDSPADLVGHRLLSIIPARYHQAHVAGFTLHLVNGRDPLLGNRITVPAVCADGTERLVDLVVEAQRLPHGRRVFTAEFFG